MCCCRNVNKRWWGSTPWPAIGPEVSGGSTADGHVYTIPARACYDRTSQTDGILNFDATRCYSNGGAKGPKVR